MGSGARHSNMFHRIKPPREMESAARALPGIEEPRRAVRGITITSVRTRGTRRSVLKRRIVGA